MRGAVNGSGDQRGEDVSGVISETGEESTIDVNVEEVQRCEGECVLLKEEGNMKYREGEIGKAMEKYSEAIDITRGLPAKKDYAVFYGNRGQCYLKLEDYDMCIDDCT